MSSAHSGGPIGVDPFGECPGNPKDGEPKGKHADHEIVVTRRILRLNSELREQETELQELRGLVDTNTLELSRRLAECQEENKKLQAKLLAIEELAAQASE